MTTLPLLYIYCLLKISRFKYTVPYFIQNVYFIFLSRWTLNFLLDIGIPGHFSVTPTYHGDTTFCGWVSVETFTELRLFSWFCCWFVLHENLKRCVCGCCRDNHARCQHCMIDWQIRRGVALWDLIDGHGLMFIGWILMWANKALRELYRDNSIFVLRPPLLYADEMNSQLFVVYS